MLADNAAQRYQSQTRQIMQRHSATQSAAVSQRMGKRNPRYPTRIEDYEVGAIIGRGGFAVVHQAVSKHKDSYGAEVAIKMIDKAVMTRSNLSSRVQTELQIHSNLSHPSILQLHTYFESASHVYLVTELCPHGELYRYIQGRTNGHLTEAEARGALEEIVKGVLYLHSLGIIHRDLKLSNVLLTRDYHLKIADFGLAVKLNTPEGEQKTMCGTPNYISPEIVSRLPYGLSSDLWSLGCLMVTILTGKPPFDSQAVKSTLDKVARVEYYLPDSISHDARDLIGKLLMKDPKKRLTLRDILNHRWFSYPRLPLKSNAPRQDTLDEASDGQTTKEERTFAARENQPQITFANSTSQPEKFSSFGDEHIDTPLFSSVSTQKTNKSPRMTSTPICNAGMHSFSTLRLKAMQQKTKHGLISIQANGNVLLDFEREKHLIVISGESSLVISG
ncbi:kinase-like domain-containing protein [Chytriomyces sp. MP71]|nr:kinase-like domain-containing protein [Chytriomyces sp. MP71]